MLERGFDANAAFFEVGYTSPSHFNREYKKLFGQFPRQHIVTLSEMTRKL